ncbi:MAG: hypothetical protein ACRDD8_03515 [Bacteroidales bacterium]
MIYNSFVATHEKGKLILTSTESILSVVSINAITFNIDANKDYNIKVAFNNSDEYVDISEDLLLNLTSIMDESADVKLMFIFDDSEDISRVEIDYTSAYELMLGVVDESVLYKMMSVDDLIEKHQDETADNDVSRSSDIAWLSSVNKLAFWKGPKANYDKITTKNNYTLYYLTDTAQVYLGTVIISNYLDVSWGAANGTQSNKINIGGSEKEFSLSSHTHSAYVPTSRTINGRALSANITLTAADVGALDASGTIENANKLKSILTSITQSPTAGYLAMGLIGSTNSGTAGTAGTGGFPVSNNANAVLTIATSGTNYHTQMGFSSNGNLYHRHLANKALDTSTPWKQIWDSTSFDPANKANVDQVMYLGSTAVNINRSSAALTLSNVNISGTAGSVAWANVTGKPDTFEPSTHNHTTLTGVTNIAFAAHSNDAASIRTTISSVSTYMDFVLSDDVNQEKWRWMFIPSGGTEYVAMELSPVSATAANLRVSGEISGNTLKSTVSTGTSPIVVSSSTLVPNLNAQYLSGVGSGSFMRTDTNTSTSGILTINNTTESTTTGTGSLVVKGGVGVAKNVNVAGDVSTSGKVTSNNGYNFGGSAELTFNSTNKSIQFIFK